jgi:hypothetical protein
MGGTGARTAAGAAAAAGPAAGSFEVSPDPQAARKDTARRANRAPAAGFFLKRAVSVMVFSFGDLSTGL